MGILQQEPPLDEDKTVLENIQMAFGDVLAKIDHFNEIGAEMADPDADFDALMPRWATCKRPSMPPTAGILIASFPKRWTRCNAPTPKRPSQCSPAANAARGTLQAPARSA